MTYNISEEAKDGMLVIEAELNEKIAKLEAANKKQMSETTHFYGLAFEYKKALYDIDNRIADILQ